MRRYTWQTAEVVWCTYKKKNGCKLSETLITVIAYISRTIGTYLSSRTVQRIYLLAARAPFSCRPCRVYHLTIIITNKNNVQDVQHVMAIQVDGRSGFRLSSIELLLCL